MIDYEIEGTSLDTPDGRVYCMNVRDLREVMEKHISAEFGEFVSFLINESSEDTAYETARAYTDADAIAEENDYLRTQLQETQEVIESITDDIVSKQRINKDELFHKLLALSQAINECL